MSLVQNYEIINDSDDHEDNCSQSTSIDDDKYEGNATIRSSVFTLANTVIGAGILGFPSAISNTGYIPSIILFVFVAVMTSFTLHLNMLCAQSLRPKCSYKTLCEATIPQLKILVDVTVASATFGVLCAYLIVVGDSIPPVIEQFVSDSNRNNLWYHIFNNRRTWIGIYTLIFILPFLYLRSMNKLRHISTFAIIGFLYVVTIVVLYSFRVFGLNPCADNDNNECRGKIEAIPNGDTQDILNLFKSLPIFLFAYACHANSFAVVNELKDCTISRINIIIVYTVAFCCILYCTVGYAGYYTYGSNCTSDLLVKYPKNSISIVIVRIGLSIAVAFSYPIIAAPCRQSLSSLIFGTGNANLELSKIEYISLTTIICLGTIIIAMTVTDLGIVLGIVGATGATAMLFILPGLFYYNLKHKNILPSDPCHKCRMKGAIIIIIMGCIIMPFCIIMQFI